MNCDEWRKVETDSSLRDLEIKQIKMQARRAPDHNAKKNNESATRFGSLDWVERESGFVYRGILRTGTRRKKYSMSRRIQWRDVEMDGIVAAPR